MATLLSSAALLGSSVVAMTLGHWYLLTPNISFAPLRRLTIALAVSLAARSTILVVAFVCQQGLWSDAIEASGMTSFLLSEGIFHLARVLFGIAAPLVLIGLVWKCVKIRSNQSATGILYVIVAFVILGEILAKRFLLSSGFLL